MKKAILLVLTVFGMVGCASSGRVDNLESLLRTQSAQIQALQVQHAEDVQHIAELNSRVTNHDVKLNQLSSTFKDINRKLDRAFQKSLLK